MYKENCTQVDIDTVVRVARVADKENVRAVGNRVTVLDAGNKLIDEFSAQRVMPVNSNNRVLVESALLKYVDTTVKGHNLMVLSLGTTNSGKEYLVPGSKSETGIVTMFLESLYASLDLAVNARSSKKESLTYSVRFQFVELVDQKVTDLMSSNKYTALEVRQDPWQGSTVQAKWTTVKNFSAARSEMQPGFKNRANSMNQLGDMSGKSCCMLFIEVTQKFFNGDGLNSTITSRVVFCELPGLEVLKNRQGEMRIKEEHSSIRGLVSFCAILKHLAENSENPPLYETSKLTHLLKEYLGGNAFAVAILSVASNDPQGSIETLKFIKALQQVPQYPIFNNGQSIGLLHKIRTDKSASQPLNAPPINSLQSQRLLLQNNLSKIRSQDDYRRILQKYTQLKNKYNTSLKAKNDIQLELIKSEQEKLEISKNIVELQIENTRLLEELQGKEYQMGRKILKAESSMIEKEVANSKYAERLGALEEELTKALDTKRDLEVEFIALKKNYITQQKELQEMRKVNEQLGLDVINLNNQNKYKQLQVGQQLMRGSRADQHLKLQIQQLQKDKSQLLQSQKFLKSQVQRYRDQVVKYQLSLRDNAELKSSTSSRGGNDYRRLELENQKIQLSNRVKLLNRRIDELQEMNGQLSEDAEELRAENRQLAELEVSNTAAYRGKLEKIAENDTAMAIGQLKQSFNSVQKRNKQKLQQMHRKLQQQRSQSRSLAAYSRQLKQLAIQYAPKGIQLPTILTQARPDLDVSMSGDPSQVQKLKTKNRKLEQQLSIMKSISRQGSVLSNERIAEQINFLKTSNAKGEGDTERLRSEKNQLQEENRKLVSMLRDGKKMDGVLLQKENQELRKEINNLRLGKESVSPNSGDQKLQYYEKHLKKLEKERSQLLVRCTVAEEQLRTMQQHYARKK